MLWKTFTQIGLALLLATAAARAELELPHLAPVEALLRIAGSYVAAHPAAPEAHYTLARIHYLAFARGEENVPVFREGGDGELPVVATDAAISFDLYEARQKRAAELALKDIGESGPRPSSEKASAFEEARGKRARQLEEQDWHPRGNLPPDKMIAHAAAALAEFRKACQLDPKNGGYVLGLAALHEKFARWGAEEKPKSLPPELRNLSIAAARDAYLHAFRLAIGADGALPFMPAGGPASLVSHEAGNAYVRLVDQDRSRLKAAEKMTLEEVKSGLKKVKKLRVGPITPL
jgi:hypothetical protein